MSFFGLLKAEFRAIFTNAAILLTVFGGSILYSFLYPQPYVNQLPKEQKIVLVDLDLTPYSRKVARMVDASAGVSISKRAFSLQEAKQSIEKNEAMGYLLIPKNFYKDVNLGKSPSLVYGGNATYFLTYGTIAESIFEVSKKMNSDIKLKRKLYDKKTLSSTKNQINLNSRPVFNTTIGYMNYIIPAVFILILHQIILIGVGLQGATQTGCKDGYWSGISTWKLYSARMFAHFVVYVPICLYYIGFCFEYYHIPHLANLHVLSILLFSMIFSAIALGLLIGEIFPRRELVTFFVLISSMPLVFSIGFIWPVQLVEPWVSILVQFVPLTPAVLSMLELNQMGADFVDVYDKCLQVILLGIMYLAMSVLILRYKKHSIRL